MKNSEYWAQRFVQLEKAQHEFANTAVSKIDKMYQNAIDDIERKVLKWYQRLADNNKITLAEAKRFLVGSDLKEFKWDVNEYIAYAKENALDGKWAKELENASAKFHISKLEALKIHVRQSLEALFTAQFGTIDSTLKKVYKSGYYKTAYELQKGFNVGFDIVGVDQSQIEKIIAKPWAPDGYNFSERIWKNKNQLINTIHNEITQNILTGADPQKAINAIAKKMNTSKFNAGRLVMTEEAYFSSAAQKDCFSELGVEQYEIVATLDTHTSDVCRNLDGKHYPMSEYKAGVTAPPFHVYCRSTTAPYFDDDFGQIGQRAARDENGKTYYVPDNMTYAEWQKAFINVDKSGLTNAENGGIIKPRQIAQQEKFSVSDFDVFEDTESVDKLKKFAADKMGIKNISGVEKLKNGKQVQEILLTVNEISQKFDKRYSSISIVNFGNQNTVAETFGNELRLNVEFMNRPEALQSLLDKWEKDEYIPKACNNLEYIGKHEFFHLLTQDLIDTSKSEIVTEVNRQKIQSVSKNAKKDLHEYVSDLLSGKKLTSKQQKLKEKIINIILRKDD